MNSVAQQKPRASGRIIYAVAGLLILTSLSACTAQVRPALRPSAASSAIVASWYGPKYHGRQTASGEIFDMNELTAAHRTLPFGTMLRVTYPKSRRSVVVKINDRGPFIRGRSLDLSFGAAAALDMVDTGVARVVVERLP